MLRVAMLVTTDLLHDNRVRREAETLAGAGYQVTVFSHIRGEDVARLRWDDRANLKAVPVGPAAWTRARGAGRVLRHGNDLLRWGGSQALLEAAGSAQADVYHAHDLDTLPAAAQLARRTGAYLVFDAHELFVALTDPRTGARQLPWSRRLKQGVAWRNFARLERALIGQATAVITVSASIAGEFVRRYHIAQPVLVLNCPPYRDLSTGSDYLRARLGLTAEDQIILFQGGLFPYHNLLELVQSLALLPDTYKLVFLGFNIGFYQEPVRKEIARLGLERRVHMLDALPPEQYLQATASADVGTILLRGTTLNERFAMPNKLFEYMMAGLPFLATGWPDVARVVQETGAGAIIPDNAPETIAGGIREILADPARHRGMRQAGLAAARRKYSWEHQAECLLGLYERLQNRDGSAR